MRRQTRVEDGFTLVEVLVSMIILGIGVAALLTAFGTQAKTSLANRNQSAASALLVAAAEYVKSVSYTNNGTHCNPISGTVPTSAVPYDTSEFTVTFGPGAALPGGTTCALQQVPVNVDGVSNGYHLSVTVVKRPDVEPTP
jgi:prepilin-type N-terminal cleavage/methylation domain-containing protein